MEVANTLAYYDMARITAVKTFIAQAQGVNSIKKYWSSLIHGVGKLDLLR